LFCAAAARSWARKVMRLFYELGFARWVQRGPKAAFHAFSKQYWPLAQ
jgi:hypothetical protein